jgi:trimeric autotransporter adhesin
MIRKFWTLAATAILLGLAPLSSVAQQFGPPSGGPKSSIPTLRHSESGHDAVRGAAEPATTLLQFSPAALVALAGSGTCATKPYPTSTTAATLGVCNGAAAVQDASENYYVVDEGLNTVYKIDSGGNATVYAGAPSTTGSYSGDSGQATAAGLNVPLDVALDASGNLYIADYGNNRVRKVNAQTGVITTFAGGASGILYNGGSGTALSTSGPIGLAFDADGNLYFTDSFNAIVIKLDSSANSSIFAGELNSGAEDRGYSGDGGPATSAQLYSPQGLAFDQAGNLYIADSYNNVVRKVDTSGKISTYAGDNQFSSVDQEGGAAVSSPIGWTSSVATDPAGDVFTNGNGPPYTPGGVPATQSGFIHEVSTSGILSHFAGGGTGGAGGPATSANLFTGLTGAGRIDQTGNLIIPARNYFYLSGTTGILQFGYQQVGLASAPLTVTLTNSGNQALTFGTISGGNFGNGAGLITGDFAIASGGTCTYTTIAPGKSCTIAVTFTPTQDGARVGTISLASNAAGSPGVVELQGDGTGVVPPNVTISPALLNFGTINQDTISSAMSVQLTNNGSAAVTISSSPAPALSGANASSYALTSGPNACGSSLAASASCNYWITFNPTAASVDTATFSVTTSASDTPLSTNITGTGITPTVPRVAMLQITPSLLTLFAGNGNCSLPGVFTGPAANIQFCGAYATATDSKGNTYVIDNEWNTVLKIDSTGTASIYAGTPSDTPLAYSGDNGPAASATLNGPLDIVLDANNNLYISDWGNQRIREVDANTGYITTFAGTGSNGYFNGGYRTQINVQGPSGMTIDPSGNFYFSTNYGMTIVKIDGAGNASLFAGEASDSGPGIAGYSGDGGPAYDATLDVPQGLASDASGNIYIADTVNNVIRMVNPGGTITTIAGDHALGVGDTGNGSSATAAEIASFGVSTDPAGDLYITSGGNGPLNVVRQVNTGAVIENFAGGGSGAIGGPATSALLATPYFARPDLNGNLIIPMGKQVVATGATGILQFPSQAVGTTSSAMTTTLTNTGNENIYFNTPGANFGDGFGKITGDFAVVSGGTCGSSGMQAGGSCTLMVTFTPTQSGTRTGTITLGTSAPNGTSTIQLSGNGTTATPAATLTPNPLAFGNQTAGTASAAMAAVLTNTSSTALSISGITLSGTPAGEFALSTGNSACNSTSGLAANASCNIWVTFKPTSTGPYTSTLTVTDNASPTTQAISLTGTGTAPAAPVATLTPSTYGFPNQAVGTTSAAAVFTLSNKGNAPLTNIVPTIGTGSSLPTVQPHSAKSIRAVKANGNGSSDGIFTVTTGSNACGSTLAAGSTCSIYVTFGPTAALPYVATLSVADNAANTPQTSALSGTGVATAPTATLAPTSLAFGNQDTGTTSAGQNITLSNSGNAPLSNIIIILSEPSQTPDVARRRVTLRPNAISSSADYNATTTCAATLAAGSNCTVSVTFSPSTTGSLPGTVTVTDNAANSPQTASLSGTGVAAAPIASLAPTSLAFGNQTTGTTSAGQSITLSNTGNAPLTNIVILISDENDGDARRHAALKANAIASSADYNATTTCAATLAAGSTCTITVTFSPASVGSLPGTVTVTDDDANSPQSASLTGTGVAPPPADFTIAATPASQTVIFGGSGSYTVTLKSTGGAFTSAIALSASGLPAGATASFSPTTVTPGSSSGTSTLTVQTDTAQTAQSRTSLWPLATPALALLFFLPFKRWRRAWGGKALLLVLGLASLASAAALSGCSGGFALNAPAQNYTITVTGTGGGDTHATTVQLTVQ